MKKTALFFALGSVALNGCVVQPLSDNGYGYAPLSEQPYLVGGNLDMATPIYFSASPEVAYYHRYDSRCDCVRLVRQISLGDSIYWVDEGGRRVYDGYWAPMRPSEHALHEYREWSHQHRDEWHRTPHYEHSHEGFEHGHGRSDGESRVTPYHAQPEAGNARPQQPYGRQPQYTQPTYTPSPQQQGGGRSQSQGDAQPYAPRWGGRPQSPAQSYGQPQGGGRSQSPATQPYGQPQGGGRQQSPAYTQPPAQPQGSGRQPSDGHSSGRRKDAEDLRHLDMRN